MHSPWCEGRAGPPWRGPGGGNHTNINTTWTGLDWGWTGWENHQTQSLIHPGQGRPGQAESTILAKYPGKHKTVRLTALDGSYQFCVLSDLSTKIGSYKDNWSNILSQMVTGVEILLFGFFPPGRNNIHFSAEPFPRCCELLKRQPV